MTDVEVTRDGSLIGFRPIGDDADKWFDDNVESEGWQWLGSVLWIDYRFANQIIDGLEGDGLTVS